ncbi:MAG: hypothetical protein CMP91_00680 [Gammaproteobacteria bacterium]|nr:hypothetical protein [Gammaproteobacteria bacterium]
MKNCGKKDGHLTAKICKDSSTIESAEPQIKGYETHCSKIKLTISLCVFKIKTACSKKILHACLSPE